MNVLYFVIGIPAVLVLVFLIVLALVTSIKKTLLNNKIKNVIYKELVARSADKTPKELAEYMKLIKKS